MTARYLVTDAGAESLVAHARHVAAIDDLRNALQILEGMKVYPSLGADPELVDALAAADRRCRRALTSIEEVAR